ncbi:MAG: hypothetical protein ABXS91_06425 [Sulfurimonas sp.]
MKRALLKTAITLGLLSTIVTAEDTTFNTAHFAGSGNCTRCHNGMSDPSGNDMSIETAWSSTMMANSTKDPLWKAKVRTEINRNPHLEEVLNDKCTKCHAPMANTEAHFSGHTVKVFDDGFLNAHNTYHDAALNGVSCTACHQIKDNGKMGTLEGMSGKYEIDGSRTIYGQYSDVFANPMINNVDYTIEYSAHMDQSKMCATCHNLKTPYVDEKGNLLSTTPESEFPEQMPYSEWEHSNYKDTQSCQDCHMKKVDGVPISTRPRWIEPKNGFAQHMFVGGNKLLLDILDNNKAALDVTSNNFATTIAKSDEMLKSAASIEVLNQSLQDGTLEITLKINSTTGHKLPTSFPSRRAFIHLKVNDQSGTTVFESGKVNSNGSIAGVDADSDRTTYEPHYDLITSPDQVQIYETIMQNSLGEVTYTLLRGMSYLKDNRILPLGFDKATAHSDIKVHGNATSDNNFVGGSDTITYRISGLTDTQYTIDTELLYQTLAYSWAQDLFSDSSSEVATFKGMFETSSMKTSQIASAHTTISGSGTTPTLTECSDGLDNDGDGAVDMDDAGCSDLNDDDEYNAPEAETACSDGLDNDGDGLIDMDDAGCSDSTDDDESNPVQTTVLQEGFENGMENWTVTGSGHLWSTHTNDPYEGLYSAYVNRTRTHRPTYMERAIDLSGYTDATISYHRRLKGLDSADDFSAEYFDGSWHYLEHLGNHSENGDYVSKSYTIPTTATKIRFMCETGGKGEKCYVDSVKIIAE